MLLRCSFAAASFTDREIFLDADSSSYQHFSSPQRAHVTFFVKRHKLELAFWLLCSVHAVIQVPPDGVVGSRNYLCHGEQYNKMRPGQFRNCL